MAVNIKCQLSNSEGLVEVIVFEGLSYPIVVHPTIHGEPLLTAQAYYYLEQLESVAEIRFEDRDAVLSDQEIEYLIDNYLYEFSKYNESKVSAKVSIGKYWPYDDSDMYCLYDHMNTKALVLDEANDESVLSIYPIDVEDKVSFNNWCIVKNYSDEMLDSFLTSMSTLINKKVHVTVFQTDERDGYIGKARLLKCDIGLVDYYQAAYIDGIRITDIKPNALNIQIKSSIPTVSEYNLPIRRVFLEKYYNPILLSYYFSGLKEHNPLLQFVGFYNVLEYYFEEAPILLGEVVKVECDQLRCVLKLLVGNEDISQFVAKCDHFEAIHSSIQTSSLIEIAGFAPSNPAANINELARWLYEIRCAVVHSKKTRKGRTTAIFEPYSMHSQNIKPAIPIVKWLAILCIEKDYELRDPALPYSVKPLSC